MVKTNLNNTLAARYRRASEGEQRLLQLEVFPERLLGFETARKLIGELNKVGGIRRMIVYGPGLPRDDSEDLLQGRYGVNKNKYLDILGEKVRLTVQVGRVWVEAEDSSVKEKIREACEKTLPFSFEIHEGLYMRTRKTVTDYVRRGGKVDDISLGMFDPQDKRIPSSCAPNERNERI